jgi:hypothetical protein
MKRKLLTTVAVAAVVGFGGVAVAQTQSGGESGKSPSATQERSGSGGGMSGSQSGSKSLNPSSTQSNGRSAQDTQKSSKDNERLGQGANQEQKGMTRGAQDEKRGMEQKGAQQDRDLQKNKGAADEQREKNVRGAQDQRGTKGSDRDRDLKGAQKDRDLKGADKDRDLKGADKDRDLKGAQDRRGTTERNATEQRGINDRDRNATEQRGQTGVNTGANVESRGSRGGSVQISEDQRSQIKTIIGRSNGPRLGNNVNFDVRVGTRVPRDVHFVTLPEEIVRIVPQYRGFDYVLVGDEIVIIDPQTLEIVAVIPA